jgi:ubiquinone/menaquinone biosynthesis C-methylase UbiE
MKALELRPDDRLLDVGCGTGAAVRKAAPLVERAVGADLSPAMIARARELAEGLPNAEFHEADSERLPFEDGAFTAVLCTTSFHHYPDPARASREMARVLAPGGRVVIGDGSSDRLAARVVDLVLRTFQPSHVRLYRSQDLERLLADSGLSPDGSRSLWNGGYVIMTARKPPKAQELTDSRCAPRGRSGR